MKDTKSNLRRTAKGLLAGMLLVASAAAAHGQAASASYRGAARDPFVKYKPPVKRKAPKPTPVSAPDIQARINNYKARKQAAMSLQQPAPKPTTALLLSEVQVIGIFRTPRGYAAMVEATPIKLSYVVYPGEPFYDGMLVAIEESRLVFRKQTRWSDGRTEVAVESKPLRQANVADSVTTARAAEAPAAQPKAKADVNSLLEVLKALATAGAQQNGQEAPPNPPQAGGKQ
jgi:hypothetical protein